MAEPMTVDVVQIGTREFLQLGSKLVPVDRILKFDFDVANGGASGESVEIVTDAPEIGRLVYAFENCEAIRNFILENSI